MVGEGPELAGYEKLVKSHHLEEHVIFHGFLAGQKLDEIFNMSDIAVECLGCHRNHVYLESSLKSREYAAKGLPFISSCKIDVFPEDYPYLLNAPADESPLNMEQVIGFYQEIYGKESVQAVIRNIRSYALSHCDMEKVMKPILDYYQISAE
jgi:glycosyltransferase involved in cell wall biosynthesis